MAEVDAKRLAVEAAIGQVRTLFADMRAANIDFSAADDQLKAMAKKVGKVKAQPALYITLMLRIAVLALVCAAQAKGLWPEEKKDGKG